MRHDNGITPRRKVANPAGEVGPLGGLGAFAGGIGFVLLTPRVWGYALVPATMLLLLSCRLTRLATLGAHYVGAWMIGPEPSGWGVAGSWILKIALDLVGLVVAVLLALSLAQPLSGFALEAISHAQEVALTGTSAPKTSFLTNLISTAKAVMVALLIGGALMTILC